MGILDKLTTAGSVLTDLDGKTPKAYDGVSNYENDLKQSRLDLDGKKNQEYIKNKPR
mgnify:CR=1 FL=1